MPTNTTQQQGLPKLDDEFVLPSRRLAEPWIQFISNLWTKSGPQPLNQSVYLVFDAGVLTVYQAGTGVRIGTILVTP